MISMISQGEPPTMEVDQKLHKTTQYRIPTLKASFQEVEENVKSYRKLKKNWDSYGANPISADCINRAMTTLNIIFNWFKTNIGFLNNRIFKIYTMPLSSGEIHIGIVYECYTFDIEISSSETSLKFAPTYINNLDGLHTIADRYVDMLWSKDVMKLKTTGFDAIPVFLNEAFYQHKWKFEPYSLKK
jgi:hypothetical protein